MSSCIAADASLSSAKPAWRAVYALALGVFGLIVAEFLPASLLTPMASSLGVSEGMAGQAVTATALVALVTGLLIATATRNIDRRWVLRRPGMLGGMLATILIFSGHFAFFTYLRPFLETVAQASVEGVSLILLGFGIANFIGTSVASYLLSRSLCLTLALVPLMMSVLALLMVTFGHLTVLAGLLVALWGFAFGLVPVAWSTWLATTVPDEAESAGGLLVASIQLAISAGAAGGGAVFDLHGASGVFTGSGLLLLSSMVIVFAAVRVKPVARADQPVTGRLSREIDN